MNPDRMIYFVQVDYGSRLGRAFVERDPGRMDRKSTIEDITRGEWHANIVQVLECNPVEHICSDVTAEIMSEVAAEIVPVFPDAQAARFDRARDYRKHSQAAE